MKTMKFNNPQRVKKLQSVVYFLAILTLGFIGLVKSATLPDLAQRADVNISQITYILTLGSIGFMIGTVLGGRFYDRFPGHKLLAGAMLLAALMMGIIPFLNSLWLMLIIFFILGIAHGLIEVGGNTLILWVHGKNSGPYMSALHFFFGVGAFLSPLLVGIVVQQTGEFDWSYWLIMLIIVPIALFFALIPSPTIREEPEKNPKSMANRTINTNTWLIIFLALFLFLYVGTEAAFSDWIFTYAKVRLPQEIIARAYQLTSAFWIAMTIGRLVSIPLSIKIDARLLLTLDVFGRIISLGIILFGGESLGALWIGTILLGFSMASIFPLTFVLAERLMDVSGRISSYLMLGASSGSLIFPWLLGQIFEFVGPRSIMVTLFIAMLLDLGIFALLTISITRSKTKIQG
ncbi:MAG: MFS transporter [Anaerolineaceae bacterium]|nr:MFS transporter [Anaerolineaceae bacterium]